MLIDWHLMSGSLRMLKATTLLSPTMTHGQAFSTQYSMKMSGLFMVVRRLYHLIQCNAWEVDVLDQPGCIMRWTLGRGKPRSHVGYANNWVTIVVLVRTEIKFSKLICTNIRMYLFPLAMIWSSLLLAAPALS